MQKHMHNTRTDLYRANVRDARHYARLEQTTRQLRRLSTLDAVGWVDQHGDIRAYGDRRPTERVVLHYVLAARWNGEPNAGIREARHTMAMLRDWRHGIRPE